MDDLHSQLKSGSTSDMAPFVIELEGRGAVCVRGDSVYELTKCDGNRLQVTGLVSQDGISFFPLASDLTQNDDLYVGQPLLINVPVANNSSEFVLDEDAVAVSLDEVSKKEFQEIDTYEITDNITPEMGQFSEFDNKVSILEVVDTPDSREKSIPQSVIRKHSSCDIVCELKQVDLLSTLIVDPVESLKSETSEINDLNSEIISNATSATESENIKKPQKIGKNFAEKETLDESLIKKVNEVSILSSLTNKRGRPKKETEIEPPIRKGPFICEICNTKVATWSQLRTHKLDHVKDNKPYSCKICSSSFNVEKNLNLHMLLHNVGNLTCPECSKTFTRFASFKAHLPVHEEEENVFCPECGDEFTNRPELDKHIQEHRKEWEKELNSEDAEAKSSLSCKACNRIFTNSITFERHKRDHQRLKNQLLSLAPKRKKKRFRNLTGVNYGNECAVCKKTFPKPSQLVRHIRIHTGEKPFKCSICSTAFSQKGSLQIHMSKHNGHKPHVCSSCSLSFSQRGNLISHVNKVHRIPKEGEEIYKCVKCPCFFKKLASLNCHVTRFHIGVKNSAKTNANSGGSDTDNFLNQISDLQSSDSDILQTAIRISGLPVTIKPTENIIEPLYSDNLTESNETSLEYQVVTIADKTDGSIKYFSVRQRREGSVRWHQCNLCVKEFKKPSDLIRHMRIHTREKPFKCNQCFRMFSIKSSLKSHVRTHLGSKTLECTTCGKKMASSRSLKTHQNSHYGVRPFTCNVCTKSFTTSGQLKTHCSTNSHKTKEEKPATTDAETNTDEYFFEEPFLIVGDGELRQQLSRKEKLISRCQNASSAERPYECEYCQLKFRKSSHLKQHKLQHTGEKPFSCIVCHKNFTTNGVLKMHLKTHLGQKDYGCDKCTSKFSTKGSLKRHIQTFHSEDRRYMCPYCQKKFKTSVNCRKHIKIHRYDNSQQFYKLKLNEVYSEENKVLSEQSDVSNSVENEKVCKADSTEAISQTLLADSTGTITLSALSQETLTQESIRELEQTLNQQLFGSEQGPEYTVQMISSVGNEKENEFIEPSLLSKSLILNVDENIREPSLVHTVFSQTEELQTVSNMSEILPDTKEPKTDYIDNNDGNDKENEENLVSQKEKTHLTCKVCNKECSSLQILKIHNKTHEGKREFMCDLCGWGALTKSSLRRHVDSHSDVKKFVCTECPAKFRLELHLKKHKKLHEESKEEANHRVIRRNKGPFREFSDAETELLAAQDVRLGTSVSEKVLIESAAEKVRMEEKKKVDEEPEKETRISFGNDCKYCQKSFRKPSDLTRHIRVHTGERPFQCNQCNKCFRVKSTLSSHLRTHNGLKTVSCHICQSMFAAKSSLKVHMRLHTGAKPFECPICDQRFRTSGHRKNHLLSHAKNKPKAWKKQQLQMLNKIAVALVVNLPEDEEEEEEKKNSSKNGLENNENIELQQTFENNLDALPSETENDSLLQLSDQNNIVELLSAEQSDNEIVPAIEEEDNSQQSLQFQIYTLDGQVYITHPSSDLIICSEENVESISEKKNLSEEDPKQVPWTEETAENVLTKMGHVCRFCSKIFPKKSLLDRHLRVHTGERPFSCDICGKRFTQSNALNAHLKVHSGDRDFSCPYCDFSCVQKGNLRIHMSRTHQFAYFMNHDKRIDKLKNVKNNLSLLSNSLLKNPDKSPTGVRTSDLDQVMGELFPQVT